MLMISSVGENESIKWYNYFGKLAIARKSYTYAQQMTQQCPGTLFFFNSYLLLNYSWFWTYFWTVVLEKILESPLDCKEIQPVNPKGNQSWIFTGRTHAEAETLIFWPPDVKNRFIGKDPDAGKDRRWEKVTTEDKMVGWHHRLDGHEFE